MTTTRGDKYVEKDEIDHILTRPDMYCGSIKRKKVEEYIAVSNTDNTGYNIKLTEITVIPALVRIYIEILSNAIDNVARSRKEGIPCKKIKISIDKETGETSIWNDGAYIPIEKKDDGRYIHTMIFGYLRTSENYNDDEDRDVSGRNGVGATLTNIFSKHFKVEGVDPEVGKKIVQTWSNNMRTCNPAKVTSSSLKTGYTHITYTPDFEHIGIKGYTKNIIMLYIKYALDCAMLTNLPVYINDTKITITNLCDYAKLYLDEDTSDTDTVITTTTTDSTKNVKEVMHYVDPKSNSEVVLLPNKDYRVISFVNGICTPRGGKHVDSWSETLFRPLVEKFNKNKKVATNFTIKDIKQKFYLFVNCTVVNPEFESQNKYCLEAPDISTSIPVKYINALAKWPTLVNHIDTLLHHKEILTLKKTEGKKRGYIKIDKLDSANKEGTKYAHECILIICEGDSAKTYATTGIETGAYGKRGRDWYGIMALRGKSINTRNCTAAKIGANKELTNLIQALGLTYDTDYTIDKNYKKLKYGTLMVLCDQDVDGFHIFGLVINNLYLLFPSLFKREKPFIVQMNTPIAKIPRLNKIFFDEREYNEFMLATENRHKGKYYKGLGTSSRQEVKDTFGKKIVELQDDEHADATLCKVFDTKCSSMRKKWLRDYDPEAYKQFNNGPGVTQLSVSDFLDHYMIQFSIADCKRNLPQIMDGLKESQRKVLYGCLSRNQKSSIKVSTLQGYIAADTQYHHGEASLQGTITGMAACYTGGNNLPLLTRGGEAGTRVNGGHDAASPRYLETSIESITRNIFLTEDDNLLTRIIDDGKIVEPEFYVPIIPMILVNPCKCAIGTGWSSTIPSFNPFELCDCVEMWLENEGNVEDEDTKEYIFPELVPWYRGFKGNIERASSTKFLTHGIIRDMGNNKVIVEELPVGYWTDDFHDYLKDLKGNADIKDFKVGYTVSEVYFEIQGYSRGFDCMKSIGNKLSTTLNTTNLVMFDENRQIKKYNNVYEIIDHYCKVRYEYIIKRKNKLLSDWKTHLNILQNKHRFISEIIDKKLLIFQRPEEDIISDLESGEYSKVDKKYDYLLNMNMRTFTRNKMDELDREINKYKSMIDKLEKTTPKDIWLNDIKKFRKEYEKMLDVLDKELTVPIKK